MKKLTALLLILALALSLCACGADAAGSAEGTWVLTGFISEGEDYSQQIKDSGLSILLQMDEDGTGYLDYGDRRDSFTWDEEGIFLNGVKLLYSIRKDTLRIGVNDQEMLFTRR